MSAIRAPSKYENVVTVHVVHCGPWGCFRQPEHRFVSEYEIRTGAVRRAAHAAPGCGDAASAGAGPWPSESAWSSAPNISTRPPPAALAPARADSAFSHLPAAAL